MTHTKLSAQNQKILNTLIAAERPLSAYDLLGQLSKSGVRSPPTIYRALDKLQELGLVHRVESLSAFVACRCDHDKKEISPFAICTACGDVQELSDPSFARLMKKLGGGFLGQVQHKVFEVSGICHACCAKTNEGRSCSL
jgi:Fur family zinc uptake transcriptional regulator